MALKPPREDLALRSAQALRRRRLALTMTSSNSIQASFVMKVLLKTGLLMPRSCRLLTGTLTWIGTSLPDFGSRL
jgi:hypothetical protein